MSAKHVIAVDLGAGSGRVMDVQYDGKQLTLNELHRFSNDPVRVSGTLYWDVLRIWREIQHGLKARHPETAGIGVDTWGVDFGLIDRNGQLVSNPVHYRDTARVAGMDWTMTKIEHREIFDRTGIQFMPINGLYQLAALVQQNSPLLDAADALLTMPDLFHYWLTGERTNEFTNATTTQMFNPKLHDWDRDMLQKIGIPTHFLAPIVQPGTQIGHYEGVPVITPPTHDTASAVVAVPTTQVGSAYLSSGTWSLLGIEVPAPVINDAAYKANVTNEGGYNDTYRFLKNIIGLWIMEQTLATWRNAGTDYSYDQCQVMAENAKQPFAVMFDPDDGRFLAPGDMPARIREYCVENGMPEPQTDADIVTAIHVSMAMKYRYVIDKLEALSGQSIHQLHIIGGGSQNRVLNQMTANAIGRPVFAGPSEATALGNAIVQLIALGELGSLSDARTLLSQTVGVTRFDPQDTANWNTHYHRFRDLITEEE